MAKLCQIVGLKIAHGEGLVINLGREGCLQTSSITTLVWYLCTYPGSKVSRLLDKKSYLIVNNGSGYHPGPVMPPTAKGAHCC